MRRIIDDAFQQRAAELAEAGYTKYRAAKALGVSRMTVRRALEALAAGLAEAGAAHAVDGAAPRAEPPGASAAERRLACSPRPIRLAVA